MHPEWDADRLRRVLTTTQAAIVVATSVDMLPRLLPPLQALAAAGCPVRDVMVLDAALMRSGSDGAIATLSASQPGFEALGIRVWAPAPAVVDDADAGTVPASALAQLLARVVAAVEARVPWAPAWRDAALAARPGDRLFPTPSPAWLSTCAAAEEAAQAAAADAATADTGTAPPRALYHPLAPPAAVTEAASRSAAAAGGTGGAGWLVAREAGDAEAALDVCGLWSVIFATGSSGVLKGVPTSRAGWASGNGVGGDGRTAPGVDNRDVVSHSSLAHGLDRGFCWRALAIGGRIGMAPPAHDHASTLAALTAFRPGTFVSMPSFWTRLYLDGVEEAAEELRQGLLRSTAGVAAESPAVATHRHAIAAALVAEQMAGLSALMHDTAGAVAGADGAVTELTRSPTGVLDTAWLARPLGSIAHALQAAGLRIAAAVSQSDGAVCMCSGGAPIGWQALAFLNHVVFPARFYDAYGATEAPGIARGSSGWLNVAAPATIRVVPLPGHEGEAAGALEAAAPGAAVRYFGADEGDAEAAAATAASFTADGWWRSGDVVERRVSKDGDTLLRVAGRAADRIELYVHGDSAFSRLAGELEAHFAGCSAVHAGQVVLDGNRDDAVIAAVAVPSAGWLRRVLPLLLRRPLSEDEAATDDGVRGVLEAAPADVRVAVAARLTDELRAHGAAEGLEPLWLPAGVVVDARPWSRRAGTLGVVDKPLRRVLLRLHSAALGEEYERAKVRSAAPPAAAAPTGAAAAVVGDEASPLRAAVAAAVAAGTAATGVAARSAAWRALVGTLAAARASLMVTATDSTVADAQLLSGVDADGAVASPWMGLLADLWRLAQAIEPLASCVSDGSTRTTIRPIIYGRGAHAMVARPDELAPVDIDLGEASAALSAPRLLPEDVLAAGRVSLSLAAVRLAAAHAPPAADDAAAPAAASAVEYREGDVVVAVLRCGDVERAVLNAPAARERALACIRRVAAAYSLPAAARPAIIVTVPVDATDGVVAAACEDAARSYAAEMSTAMLPCNNKDAGRLYSWRAPPLPTAAEGAMVQRAVAAVQDAGRRLWHHMLHDGDPAERAAGRAMAQAGVDGAVAAVEAAVREAAGKAAAIAASVSAAGGDTAVAAAPAAAEELRAFVTTTVRARQRDVAEAAALQSALGSMGASSLPSVAAARTAATAAIVQLRAAARCAGVQLPWQLETAVEYAPPADDGSSSAPSHDAASLQLNLAPPIECAVSGAQLLHGGVREEEAPARAVSMESGRSIALPIYQQLVGMMRCASALRAAAGSATPPALSAAADAIVAAVRALEPDVASGGMWTVERQWPWRLTWPFLWSRVLGDGTASYVTSTPTPAAWVAAALQTWGARPCLGLPLEMAAACCIAVLPPAGTPELDELREVDAPPLVSAPGGAGAAGGGAAAAASAPAAAASAPPAPLPHTLPLTYRVSRGYAWLTYVQLRPLVHALARTLRGLPGVARGDLVGISAPNGPEWLVTDWGASVGGLCPVGYHTTYTAGELAGVVGRTQPRVAVVAPGLLPRWLALVRAGWAPELRAILVTGAAAGADDAAVAAEAATLPPLSADLAAAAVPSTTDTPPPPLLVLPFDQAVRPDCSFGCTSAAVAAAGEDPITQTPGRADGLFTLLFTSGSSGRPKGVVISADTWRRDIGDGPGATTSVWPCVVPSFIPLSHSSDRIRCWEALGRGGRVGFAYYAPEHWLAHQSGAKKERGVDEAGLTGSSNGTETLLLHLAALRPTSAALPPRIWNGFHWLARAAAATPDGGDDASGRAMALLRACPNLDAALGGRVAVAATGGAAPNRDVWAWVRRQFPGKTVMESYGATECGAITTDGVPMPLHSGRALRLRLEPLAADRGGDAFPPPRYGEMVVRTPTMAAGYWRDPAATAAAFTPDGYFRTGDICEGRPDGTFAVVDRVGALARVPKSLAAAAGVEFAVVSPAALEAQLARALAATPGVVVVSHLALVPSAAVGGALVAAVGMDDAGGVVPVVARHGGDAGPTTAASVVLASLRAAGAAAGLREWELPAAAVVFPPSAWAPSPGGLLNVQFKVARAAVAAAVAAALLDCC